MDPERPVFSFPVFTEEDDEPAVRLIDGQTVKVPRFCCNALHRWLGDRQLACYALVNHGIVQTASFISYPDHQRFEVSGQA